MSPTPQRLQITAASPDPALLDLPWHIPLEEWPAETLAALPRGISRHIVRFAKMSGRRHRGQGDRRDRRLPRVRAAAPAAAGSTCRASSPSASSPAAATPTASALEAVLITEHLQFSLPYRALFSQSLRPDTATRLIDALAVLLVRLHLVGFYWGDVSLSNTLFRRDAETFAAYLVDAETGDLHDKLTDGQRGYDLEVARVNIIGELMDLQAGEFLEEDVDAVAIGDAPRRAVRRAVARADRVASRSAFGDRWRVQARIDRLNDLGFDVGELDITTDVDGTTRAHPAQGRRRRPPLPPPHAAHRPRRAGEPGPPPAQRPRRVPRRHRPAARGRGVRRARLADRDLRAGRPRACRASLRGKLEPAQIFHEMLDHRWFLSEQQSRDVPMPEAADELRQEHPAARGPTSRRSSASHGRAAEDRATGRTPSDRAG